MPIIRHTKIKTSANPFVRNDTKYFIQRRKSLRKKADDTKQICIVRKGLNEIDKTLLKLWTQKAG